MSRQQGANTGQHADEYRLLLSPAFAAMSKITDNIFLTGVGGMTRENFARNHIDFVVNITMDAPFWPNIESIRIAVEDDSGSNLLVIFDQVIDRMHEQIIRRNAHVLVHCVAGVSRSATLVIAYLMKVRRMNLKQAFNHCYTVRPVIRPNNGFIMQLINYEQQLFGRVSVRMTEVDVDGTLVWVPNFFVEDHPHLVMLEVLRSRDDSKKQQQQQQSQQTQQQVITPPPLSQPNQALTPGATQHDQQPYQHEPAPPPTPPLAQQQQQQQQPLPPAQTTQAQHHLNLPQMAAPMPTLHQNQAPDLWQQQQVQMLQHSPQQQQQQQQQPQIQTPTSQPQAQSQRLKSHKRLQLQQPPQQPPQQQSHNKHQQNQLRHTSNSVKHAPRAAGRHHHGRAHRNTSATKTGVGVRPQSTLATSGPSSPALSRASLTVAGKRLDSSVISSTLSRVGQQPSANLDQVSQSSSIASQSAIQSQNVVNPLASVVPNTMTYAKQIEHLAKTKRSPSTPRSE